MKEAYSKPVVDVKEFQQIDVMTYGNGAALMVQ